MKLEKLFNVLVLGGAALGVAACGSDGDDDKQETNEQAAGDGDQQTPGDGDGDDGQQTEEQETPGDGDQGDGDQGDGDQGDGDQGDGDQGDGDGDQVVDASTPPVEDAGETLACSESPSPSDPCGCPCCWSGGLNTDDSCMSFCEAGNGGKGCCDV